MWTPSDLQQRKETLIDLRLPDGQTHIFRIPIRYLHRVRRRGQRLRITYVLTTERVLDVVRVEAPVGATQASSEQA